MTFSCLGIGIGSARSIAIGEAYLLHRGRLEITPTFIDQDQISDEVDRFRQALASARRTLRMVRKKIPDDTRSDILAFIDTHLLMLEDAALAEAPIEHIRERQCSAEWALQVQCDTLTGVFDAMEDPYLRTRKDDVEHVVTQIQKILLQQEDGAEEDLRGRIILAQDLTPADTILLRHQGIAGFVTESGGPMSHTAILARSLGIPAVLGVHHATRALQQGERLVVDGEQGVVLASVDEGTLSHYQSRMQAAYEHVTTLRSLAGKPAQTLDGETLLLTANIELPEDIDSTRSLQADGVGLYRTEYLYMNRSEAPDEEEHFAAYRQVVEGLDGFPITIRTLDLGADKQIDGGPSGQPVSRNPALGLRAIRLCLKETALFIPQLRAILRVAALGPVRLMVPMLSNLTEVAKLKTLIEETKQTLTLDGLAFDPQIPIGGMIEVPAAALAADAFARELDFLSIGTNDLVQYTLAIDRVDDEVNYLYDPLHPSVLQLIQGVIDAGSRQGIPVSMCGEMAGDPRYTPLLIGMGLQEFSMQPGALLEVKQTVRSLRAGPLREQVQSLMAHIHQTGIEQRLAEVCQRFH